MLRLKSSRTPGLRLLRTWPITVAGGEGEGEFWYDGDILWKGEDKENKIIWTWSRCQFYLSIHDNTCRSMSWLRVAWDRIRNCLSNMLHGPYFSWFSIQLRYIYWKPRSDLGNLSRIDGDVLKKRFFWDFWGRWGRFFLESLCHRKNPIFQTLRT